MPVIDDYIVICQVPNLCDHNTLKIIKTIRENGDCAHGSSLGKNLICEYEIHHYYVIEVFILRLINVTLTRKTRFP